MGFHSLIESILKWPPFLAAVASLYHSVALLGITHKMQWLKLTGRRNDVFGWAKGMKSFFRFRVLKVGENELLRVKPCMYLCNHRSWADFMVDQYVTEGRSLFMSRLAVVWVFPFFMTGIAAIRSVILFKRGSIADKDKFNRWIDKKLVESPQSGLAVYPEGHRSTHGESLPLKRGMLHYAFSRKMPVQVVISSNKEAILSEKHQVARLGQTVAVGYSEVIYPDNYENFERFMSKVQETWDSEWDTVFGADWKELPEMTEPEPQWLYPLDIKILMLFIVSINIFVSSMILYWTISLGNRILDLTGNFKVPIVIAVVLYVAASFYYYSFPVDALEVHARLLEQKASHKHVAINGHDKKA